MLAPLAAVLLFLAAIISAFWYLRLEEMDREQEAVRRDVEYAQQRLRLRLLERQEQLMRIARDISNKDVDPQEFVSRAETMVIQYPELQAMAWIDERRRIRASYAGPSVPAQQLRAGEATAADPAARPRPRSRWCATCSSRCIRSRAPAPTRRRCCSCTCRWPTRRASAA